MKLYPLTCEFIKGEKQFYYRAQQFYEDVSASEEGMMGDFVEISNLDLEGSRQFLKRFVVSSPFVDWTMILVSFRQRSLYFKTRLLSAHVSADTSAPGSVSQHVAGLFLNPSSSPSLSPFQTSEQFMTEPRCRLHKHPHNNSRLLIPLDYGHFHRPSIWKHRERSPHFYNHCRFTAGVYNMTGWQGRVTCTIKHHTHTHTQLTYAVVFRRWQTPRVNSREWVWPSDQLILEDQFYRSSN